MASPRLEPLQQLEVAAEQQVDLQHANAGKKDELLSMVLAEFNEFGVIATNDKYKPEDEHFQLIAPLRTGTVEGDPGRLQCHEAIRDALQRE